MSKFKLWLEDAMYRKGRSGYRQADLARDLRVRPATVSAWFNRETIPDEATLRELAWLFMVDVGWIYRDLLDREPPEGLDLDRERLIGLIYNMSEGALKRLLKEARAQYEQERIRHR